VWADQLSRWGAVSNESQLNIAVRRINTLTPDSTDENQDDSTADS